MLNLALKQDPKIKTRPSVFLRLWMSLLLGLAPGMALSDQLVWVLGSYSDADSAQKVALAVHQLTGQVGFVQSAVVNGRAVHRALIDPGTSLQAQARTTTLLSETAYSQTWGFELDTGGDNVRMVGEVVMRPEAVPAVANRADKQNDGNPVQAAADLSGSPVASVASPVTPRVDRVVDRPKRSTGKDRSDSTSDYHPIRLKLGR